MVQLPQAVIAARDRANAAIDVHQAAWDELQKIDSPSYEDMAEWLAAKEPMVKAQDEFEAMIRQLPR